MPDDTTSTTIRSYLDALVARGDFADYFTPDVTLETVGTGQQLQGKAAVQEFINWLHTQAFDARPKVKTIITGDRQAALEADFVGVHTGEFLGMPPTGKSVTVPYCVMYDVRDDKIAALRIYMPMELLTQQLGDAD
jgi:steroid delta-isomerase-like uncharacterized protein